MFGGPGGFGRPGFGRRGPHYGYGGSQMPNYSPPRSSGTPLEAMAAANGWRAASHWPVAANGAPVPISGGPFAPERFHPMPPVVTGQAGYWPFVAATVQAMTRAGEYRPYAVTAMQFPGELPYVHIYPESWRATATSVTAEVHLESGEFNDRFSVFSDSPRTVYQLISPRAMRYLIEQPPLDELWTSGNSLCVSRVDPHSAEVLGAHLTTLTTLAGDIPSSAWDSRT